MIWLRPWPIPFRSVAFVCFDCFAKLYDTSKDRRQSIKDITHITTKRSCYTFRDSRPRTPLFLSSSDKLSIQVYLKVINVFFIEFFYCRRLPLFYSNGPYWPNSGKFDKIAFSLSADHYLLGIMIASPVQQGILVQLTIKLTDISGFVIASKTVPHISNSLLNTVVYFDEPILLTAGQQYIAASLVEAASSFPEMYKSHGGSETITCGNPQLTITFANVPPGEMEDSNGSTVQEGQITFLDFKAA